jgi:hypothetical protein
MLIIAIFFGTAHGADIPPAPDPAASLAPLLDGAGPAGLVVAGLVGIWREVRGEMQRHAAERATLHTEITALRREVDHLRLETTHKYERTADALAAVRTSLEDLR